MIWGLQPGPMLFVEKPEFVWGLIASMYTGNVIGVLVVLFFVPRSRRSSASRSPSWCR